MVMRCWFPIPTSLLEPLKTNTSLPYFASIQLLFKLNSSFKKKRKKGGGAWNFKEKKRPDLGTGIFFIWKTRPRGFFFREEISRPDCPPAEALNEVHTYIR